MKMLSLAFWKTFFPFMSRHSKRNRPDDKTEEHDDDLEHPYILLSKFDDKEIEVQMESKALLPQKGTRSMKPFR